MIIDTGYYTLNIYHVKCLIFYTLERRKKKLMISIQLSFHFGKLNHNLVKLTQSFFYQKNKHTILSFIIKKCVPFGASI